MSLRTGGELSKYWQEAVLDVKLELSGSSNIETVDEDDILADELANISSQLHPEPGEHFVRNNLDHSLQVEGDILENVTEGRMNTVTGHSETEPLDIFSVLSAIGSDGEHDGVDDGADHVRHQVLKLVDDIIKHCTCHIFVSVSILLEFQLEKERGFCPIGQNLNKMMNCTQNWTEIRLQRFIIL